MHLIGGTLAFAALAAAQSSSALFPPSKTVSSSAIPSASASANANPCAKVAKLHGDGNSIPPKLAYQCLSSVPVAVEENRKLIDQLKMMWEWHSETGWLKNPPSTWDRGPLDLIAELNKIQNSLNSFESEYHLHLAIQKLTVDTGNYHFSHTPDILSIFTFQRDVQLATVSQDGKTDPKTYVIDDLMLQNDDSEVSISPITNINGQDTQKYLEDLASWEQYSNADARYNSLMYRGSGKEVSAGAFSYSPSVFSGRYDGPETVLIFENGTRKSFENTVDVRVDEFEDITSGQSLFNTYCRGELSGYRLDSDKSKRDQPSECLLHTQDIPEDGYPEPVAKDCEGIVAGYIIENPRGQALGVLKIFSFFPEGTPDTKIQNVVKKFVAEAKKQGVDKLILDLRENSGGSVELLLDVFMQLFPALTPFSAQRYRAQEGYTLIGEAYEEIRNNQSASNQFGFAEDRDMNLYNWHYDYFLDVHNKPFDSWEAWVGPHTFNDDQFTATSRYNLSNSNRESILNNGFDFEKSPASSSPFTPDQTVMLLDGLCGSSCASLHEELKNIAGVKSVVVGGRARDGPMQAVGGTKGGSPMVLNQIVLNAGGMYNATEELGITGFDGLKPYIWPQELMTRVGDDYSTIQIQDQIRKGDSSQTPLQFIYEAADCRRLFTPKTLLDPKAMWIDTWAAFIDDDKCVPGSTGHKSSISGGYKPFGNGDVRDTMDEDSDVPMSSGAALTRPALVAGAAGVLISLFI
ncbi:hypothetical protein BDW42DRAFT_182662 [Aspergillus taichungensis]|uniref:Uncharacterized protein n=1 Tax=Aspergillus taichungensis TaxID=482145 RepID=A0A2J5I816_9EURO|nr:hypothetical protein BDW42DRAFT_182662 [Aspergillus taichungensis]